jgi:hypothetical protein
VVKETGVFGENHQPWTRNWSTLSHLYNVHTVFIQCTYSIYTMYIQYLYNVHAVFIQCTYSIYTMYTVFECILSWTRNWSTLSLYRVHLFGNLQRRARTQAVLVIGVYELLGNPST